MHFPRTKILFISVAVWSGVNVAGVNLREVVPCGEKEDSDNWEQEVHQKVISRYFPSFFFF